MRELLRKTSARIYCLVRTIDGIPGAERINAALRRYRLDLGRDAARVIAVPGDLGYPLLGLTTAQFSELAELIDVIYHNAARVNHLEPYSRLRAENVDGTSEILRLASTTRLKAVHHVSTSSVLTSTPAEMSSNGYVTSKWVAEQRLWAGIQRGIPTTIYRPGLITGDRLTGATSLHDSWWMTLRAMLILQIAPDFEGASIEMMPVDQVAAKIVQLSGYSANEGMAINLDARPIALQHVLQRVIERGFAIRTVTPEEFVHALASSGEQAVSAGDNALARAVALNVTYSGVAGRPIATFSDRFEIEVTDEVLDRYLDYLIGAGFFPVPPG